MKNLLLASAIVGCALSVSTASAQEPPAAATPPKCMDMGAGVDMDKQMSQMHQKMHDNMSAAQQQMDRFRATTDPKERRKLMRDHMQTLQDSMKMMQGPECPMKMGGAPATGTQPHPRKHMAGDDMQKHHDMMHGHMQMMQMLLEQLIQQDQMMMESIPPS
jgi:hypothetical protein